MPDPDAEQSYQLLIEAVVDYAIYMLDLEGRIISWNAGAQRLKGFADEETVGTHFSRFYPEEERQAGLPMRALEQASLDGRFEQEGWRVRRGGTRFWAHVIISPMRDGAGNLIGFAKVTRDITRQRDMLLQAHRMEAVGQLTGGLIHDFNNLLAVLLANLIRLKPSVRDERNAMDLLDSSVQVAQRGAALIKRMLGFARRREHQVEHLDVMGLILGLAPMLQQAAGSFVRVETQFPATVPPAIADALLLELAVLNLVVNARDAMPDGGSIIISVRGEEIRDHQASHPPPGHYVRLSVNDDGLGMDDVTLARVMEPLFTTKAEGKGTGLGLPMIRDFAEQSGGYFDLASKAGAGTTATIWLPTIAAAPKVDSLS